MRLFLRLGTLLLPALVGLQVATQWTAATYRAHAALGAPLATLRGIPVYPPWAFPVWLWHYGGQQPEVFQRPVWLVGASVLVGLALLGSLLLVQDRWRQQPTTFGSAAFATANDLKRSGLL
jgi:type IV secretion system protein VirD4